MFSRFKSFHLLFVLAACAGALAVPSQAQNKIAISSKTRMTTLEQVQYAGFSAVRLSDGRSEAVVVAALGRVMRFGLVGGANWLWNSVPEASKPGESGAQWRDWGGDKSWPAPQSRWPLSIGRDWPPPPSWDGEPYQSTILAGNRLRIVSGVWPGLGCRVIREFRFDPNGDFVIAQTFEKLSGPPVELSLWNITQVASPEAIYTSANPQSAYNRGFHWLTKPQKSPEIALVLPDMLRFRSSGSSTNKIGIDAPLASLVVVKDGQAFRQQTARPTGNTPDGASGSGFPIEIFDIGGEGRDHYLETEFLSPLRTFHVGTRWTHSVRWSLHPLQEREANSPQMESEVQNLINS